MPIAATSASAQVRATRVAASLPYRRNATSGIFADTYSTASHAASVKKLRSLAANSQPLRPPADADKNTPPPPHLAPHTPERAKLLHPLRQQEIGPERDQHPARLAPQLLGPPHPHAQQQQRHVGQHRPVGGRERRPALAQP